MRIAEGGYWSGTAKVKLDPSGPAYAQLVTEGLSGVARIWWIRDDEDAAGVDDEVDLLWMGLAEDAQTQAQSNTVEFSLRGIGQFLRTIPITRTFTGEKLGAAVAAVFDDVIASTGSPLTDHDVDLGGVCARRVSIEFDATPADRVLRELAQQAGGPARIAWGVRTSDDSDDMGIGYFKLWEGHHYQKTTGDQNPIDEVSEGNILSKKVTSVSSDIRNVVQVFGKEIEQTAADAPKVFLESTVEAKGSVNQFGRRQEIIFDTSLETVGQCALVAAGKVMERGSRLIDADLDLILPMDNKDRATGKAWNLLTRTLKFPAKIVPIRDRNIEYLPWGDDRKIYAAIRNTSAHSYAKIDLSNAPTARADAPLLDLTSAWSIGEQRAISLLQNRPSMVAPSGPGVFIAEWDRGLALVWIPSASDWKLGVIYRNAAGNWTLLALAGTVRTSAELANDHTVCLRVRYLSGTQVEVMAYHRDVANGTVLLVGVTAINNSAFSATGTTDRIYVNAAASSGIDTFPGATKGDSGTCKTVSVVITGSKPGAFPDFLTDIGANTFPFKFYPHLLLQSNFGNLVGGVGSTRYSYGQTAKLSEFNFEPLGDAAKSEIIEDATAFSLHRGYSWRLGTATYSREYGGHFELFPFRAKMKYSGKGAALRIRLTGESGSRTATGFIEAMTDQIQKANEASRNA